MSLAASAKESYTELLGVTGLHGRSTLNCLSRPLLISKLRQRYRGGKRDSCDARASPMPPGEWRIRRSWETSSMDREQPLAEESGTITRTTRTIRDECGHPHYICR